MITRWGKSIEESYEEWPGLRPGRSCEIYGHHWEHMYSAPPRCVHCHDGEDEDWIDSDPIVDSLDASDWRAWAKHQEGMSSDMPTPVVELVDFIPPTRNIGDYRGSYIDSTTNKHWDALHKLAHRKVGREGMTPEMRKSVDDLVRKERGAWEFPRTGILGAVCLMAASQFCVIGFGVACYFIMKMIGGN